MHDEVVAKIGKHQAADHGGQVTNRDCRIDHAALMLLHRHNTGDEVHHDGHHRHGNSVIEHHDAPLTFGGDQFHSGDVEHKICDAPLDHRAGK